MAWTRPRTATATAPQAQCAVRSTSGRRVLLMTGSSHASAGLATAGKAWIGLDMVFSPKLPILTERLRLRPFTRSDVDAVFEYRRREDVTQYLIDSPMTRQACAAVVQARIGQLSLAEDGDKIFLVVERASDSAMLGEVTLILRSSDARQGEIGYILHPRHQGRGYATEAARALLVLAFDGAGMHRVYARCDARNAASYAVMERLGMRREAHFREHALLKGAWDEELIYALLEQEWRAAKPGSPVRDGAATGFGARRQ